MVDWSLLSFDDPKTEADYAVLRPLGRTTVGKSFPLKFGSSSDVGAPARTVWQVISETSEIVPVQNGKEEVAELHQSPAGRVQVKARVVRDQGRVVELRFERVRGKVGGATIENILNLDEQAVQRLADLCLVLKGIDPTGSETLRFDENLLSAVMADPQAVAAAYGRDPERFRLLIENDVSAEDVVAIASRRKALDEFESLLNDPDEFESRVEGGRREAVWQQFFESNPWVLGVGLSSHLFTAWDEGKLEKAVAGSSVARPGKRADALLTTNGIVKSLVLAEIKLHDDPLLDKKEYRSGCWAPSSEIAGGVAQSHITADRAREDIGDWLDERDDEGYLNGDRVYVGTPRSYLVIGKLASLTREGRAHPDKVRSFELYRRNMTHPEIVTYDEVLARARWSLERAEEQRIRWEGE
ncbi:Shedu immune nuclease family protein [Nocardiopsis sp. MG754419]|uniref:Shedu immune nuclease family protein n=1 Tax=Nocardiopsis sp. MG754419 TaxID=2259865 RepID=UPI001BA5AD2A|nr:Shedu immune nuclease family protein [Nocardiopsis sp. MG754419]